MCECCPKGALPPAFEAPSEAGWEEIGGVTCYVAGREYMLALTATPGRPITGSRASAVIVAHDAFGPRSGRTQALCDELASKLRCVVVLPVFFPEGAAGSASAGTAIERMMPADPKSEVWYTLPARVATGIAHLPVLVRGIREASWPVVRPMLDALTGNLRLRGVERFSMVGLCWGGWLCVHASTLPEFRCAAAAHPSLQISYFHKENLESILQEVRCPQMLLPSSQDPAIVQPGGLAQKVLSANPTIGSLCHFETINQPHGFLNRGDLSDPMMLEVYQHCMQLIVGFIRKHMLDA